MRVLITGSSGFLGQNFIARSANFDLTEVDLLNQKVSEVNFSGYNTVLHLAALVHQMSGAPDDLYFKVNRDLTFEVAKKAKEQGVRHFVFMSTAKVFGESTNHKPAWDENSECFPIGPYAQSKFEAEKLILNLQDHDFKVAVIRSPLVYGAGVKANMYNLLRLIDKFPILPFGSIKNKRSLVYVGNLVALIQQIILIRASGIFIAGDRISLSTSELIQKLSEGLNKHIFLFKIPFVVQILITKMKPDISERLFGSLELDNTITKIKLDFEPPYTIEEGINEMVGWYKNQNI